MISLWLVFLHKKYSKYFVVFNNCITWLKVKTTMTWSLKMLCPGVQIKPGQQCREYGGWGGKRVYLYTCPMYTHTPVPVLHASLIRAAFSIQKNTKHVFSTRVKMAGMRQQGHGFSQKEFQRCRQLFQSHWHARRLLALSKPWEGEQTMAHVPLSCGGIHLNCVSYPHRSNIPDCRHSRWFSSWVLHILVAWNFLEFGTYINRSGFKF